MNLYNWQQKDWPEFRYKIGEVEDLFFQFAERVGHVSGVLKTLPEETRLETLIDIMVAEAVKTSEIEGEFISRKDVLSSVKKNLGLSKAPLAVKDKRAKGIGDLMMDVRNSFAESLTDKKIFEWHKMLLGGQGSEIAIGNWRKHKEPMQVISGAIGKEKVHFEAPPSAQVAGEMKKFINWFNETGPGGKKEIKKAPLRAAIAHLYFESIHPFEDGNGRIGRAIAEKALSQTIGRPVMLSLSKTIEADKKSYYESLQKASKSNEITGWINYFVKVIVDAQAQAEDEIEFTLKKVKFFDRFRSLLNERQLKVIKRILDEGAKGFEGGMNASKYISITKTSKATATRDLQDLLEKKILIAFGGGRSTGYKLNF
jgi:Fic family protein